jgi:hypothetical protein
MEVKEIKKIQSLLVLTKQSVEVNEESAKVLAAASQNKACFLVLRNTTALNRTILEVERMMKPDPDVKPDFEWSDSMVLEFARVAAAGAYGDYKGCNKIHQKLARFKNLHLNG